MAPRGSTVAIALTGVLGAASIAALAPPGGAASAAADPVLVGAGDISNIFAKLGVGTRGAAIARWLRTDEPSRTDP